jgi:two-component system response regulator MprA
MAVTAARILVLEDDAGLLRLLRSGLEEEGFTVLTATSGHEAMAVAESAQPDLMVVDIGLPDADGRDVCQALRARGVAAPVLFLTARDAVTDLLSGFEAGGDDYLTKPFEFAELVARLRALERRSGYDPATPVGDLRLDPVKHEVGGPGGAEALTPTEFRLLGALIARTGEAVRRRDLIRTAWPDGAIVHDNTLDVYIGRLRRKLTALGSETEIVTVHGVGYRL